MKQVTTSILLLLATALVPAAADANGRNFRALLRGTEEVPAISTQGSGHFHGELSFDGEEMDFTLSYDDLEGDVAQAHIHFGQRGVNGGISIFLCTNLGNGPAGTQECPPSPATITGTVSADDVIGPAGQGITAGEWEEVKRAIRRGDAYVNVHSNLFPGGEIRGQVFFSFF